jgi:hypothetical protein
LALAFRAANHIALHVFHAAGGFDRNAARIEANALADKGYRLFATLAAIPAHDHGPAGLRRTLGHTEQRAHTEFLHRGDVKDIDHHAKLAQLTGAAREFDREQYVRRFIDEVARGDDAVHNTSVWYKGLARSSGVADRDRHIGSQRRLLAFLFLGLVTIEFVGP